MGAMASSQTNFADPAMPGVSVVMPVLNEERHLAAAVNQILSQEYPGPIEIIMAVGPSKDRTEEIAAELAAADERVEVVANPVGRTPHALNLAIAAARYDYLVRVDGHGELTDGYIETAIELLQRTGAANVGGIMDAQGRTPFEQAVATAYTSRLGLGGSTFHLVTSQEGPADTVFLGCFRKDAVVAVGGFDETLFRAQDWELNYRLREAREKIFFSPKLRVTYRPRSSPKAVLQQFYETGKWRREVVRRHRETISLRYLAAPIAVAGVLGGSALGLAGFATKKPLLLAGWLAPVGYLGLIVAGAAALRRELPLEVRVRLPMVFAIMHMAWGAGFVRGLKKPRESR